MEAKYTKPPDFKVPCFEKNEKGADLNYLVQGGQRYWAFPLSYSSVVQLCRKEISIAQNISFIHI